MVGFHVPDHDQLPEYRDLQKQYGLADIMAHLDPKEYVRRLREAHVQLFWYYTKCHYGNAYYPSKVGHVHSCCADRDIFGEFTEACLSEGIVPGAVYECSDNRMRKDHPDWCHKIPIEATKGADLTDADQGVRVGGPCLNGPYGDFMIEQALEVLRDYPIKAYYFDLIGLFGFETWQCPYCGPKLMQDTGIDFRNVEHLSHDEYVAYVRWRYAQVDAYCKKIMSAMRAIRPDVAITHNLFGIGSAPGMHRMDFASANADFLGKDLFRLRAGMLQMSWGCRTLAGLTRCPPADALLDSVVCVAGDLQTLKAADSYRAELWTARACNAAACNSMVINIDGSIDAQAFDFQRRLNEESKPYDPWFEDMRPVANVGLLRSHDATEFRREEAPSTVRESHHVIGFEGWAQTLISGHHLWDVIWSHQLAEGRLNGLTALVLPNVSCLSEADADTIRQFVKDGGALIATGDTSLCDADGHELDNFQLADVFGVDYADARSLDRRQMRVDAPEFQTPEPCISRMLMLNDGQYGVVPHAEAEVLGSVHAKPQNLALINVYVPTGEPAFVRNRFGKGVCYYFAGAIGLNYRSYGQDNIRRLMESVLTSAAGDAAPVRLEGSGAIELFAHKQAGKDHLVVTLVYCVGSVSRTSGRAKHGSRHVQDSTIRYDDIAEMPRLAEATVVFPNRAGKAPRKVTLAPNGEELPIERTDDACRVTLRHVGVHTTLAAEY